MGERVQDVRLWVDVESGNSAIVEYPDLEALRILGVIQTHIRAGNLSGPVMDKNGNKIGSWGLAVNRVPAEEE